MAAVPAEPAGRADHGFEDVPPQPDRRDRGPRLLDSRSPADRRAGQAGQRSADRRCCSSRPTAYRGGAAQPTFWYWFRDEPTSPVTVQIMDAAGAVVYNQTRPARHRHRTAAAAGLRRHGRTRARWRTRRWPRRRRRARGRSDGWRRWTRPRRLRGRRRPGHQRAQGLELRDVEPAAAVAVHGAAAHRDVGRRRRTDEGRDGRLHRQGQHGHAGRRRRPSGSIRIRASRRR